MNTPNNFTKKPVDEATETRKVTVSELTKELVESRGNMLEHLDKVAEICDLIIPILNSLHPCALQCILGCILDEYCHNNDFEFETMNVMLEQLVEVRRENEDSLKNLMFIS